MQGILPKVHQEFLQINASNGVIKPSDKRLNNLVDFQKCTGVGSNDMGDIKFIQNHTKQVSMPCDCSITPSELESLYEANLNVDGEWESLKSDFTELTNTGINTLYLKEHCQPKFQEDKLQRTISNSSQLADVSSISSTQSILNNDFEEDWDCIKQVVNNFEGSIRESSPTALTQEINIDPVAPIIPLNDVSNKCKNFQSRSVEISSKPQKCIKPGKVTRDKISDKEKTNILNENKLQNLRWSYASSEAISDDNGFYPNVYDDPDNRVERQLFFLNGTRRSSYETVYRPSISSEQIVHQLKSSYPQINKILLEDAHIFTYKETPPPSRHCTSVYLSEQEGQSISKSSDCVASLPISENSNLSLTDNFSNPICLVNEKIETMDNKKQYKTKNSTLFNDRPRSTTLTTSISTIISSPISNLETDFGDITQNRCAQTTINLKECCLAPTPDNVKNVPINTCAFKEDCHSKMTHPNISENAYEKISYGLPKTRFSHNQQTSYRKSPSKLFSDSICQPVTMNVLHTDRQHSNSTLNLNSQQIVENVNLPKRNNESELYDRKLVNLSDTYMHTYLKSKDNVNTVTTDSVKKNPLHISEDKIFKKCADAYVLLPRKPRSTGIYKKTNDSYYNKRCTPTSSLTYLQSPLLSNLVDRNNSLEVDKTDINTRKQKLNSSCHFIEMNDKLNKSSNSNDKENKEKTNSIKDSKNNIYFLPSNDNVEIEELEWIEKVENIAKWQKDVESAMLGTQEDKFAITSPTPCEITETECIHSPNTMHALKFLEPVCNQDDFIHSDSMYKNTSNRLKENIFRDELHKDISVSKQLSPRNRPERHSNQFSPHQSQDPFRTNEIFNEKNTSCTAKERPTTILFPQYPREPAVNRRSKFPQNKAINLSENLELRSLSDTRNMVSETSQNYNLPRSRHNISLTLDSTNPCEKKQNKLSTDNVKYNPNLNPFRTPPLSSSPKFELSENLQIIRNKVTRSNHRPMFNNETAL